MYLTSKDCSFQQDAEQVFKSRKIGQHAGDLQVCSYIYIY